MKKRLQAFFGVGAIGFLLQLTSLWLLSVIAGWSYQAATVAAVELAVVHNFLWHERWTWRDRALPRSGFPLRFARFQVTTGATSVLGNLFFTTLLVEQAGIPVLAANVASVVAMSAVNFLMSDRWVFTRRPIAAAMLLAFAASPGFAAEQRPETIAAWNKYVDELAADFERTRDPGLRPEQPRGDTIGVPGGTIHHWRSSTLIRGTTVEALVRALMNPGTPPPQEDVLESRVLGRSKDSLHVYLKLVRRTIMTVTYDTEHQVTFSSEGPGFARSRSVSTKIAEVDGRDRGFLWRLNSYWRYTQVGDDVRVDLESVSLSRTVPAVLKPVAGPIISRIARESMTRTLEAMREFFERA